MQIQFNGTVASSQPRLQTAGRHKRTNREKRVPINTGAHESARRRARTDTGRGRIGPPSRDGGAGSPASRASQSTPHYGNPTLAPTPLRTGVNGHLVASADMPPTMPAPETKNQKKVRWPTSMREPMSLGGPASGGQKESQKNHFGTAEVRPTATSTRPAKTHNRRTTEPYSMPSSALIIPWSCVRITPGLLRL